MDPLNSDQVLSFLRQNPALLTQLLLPQSSNQSPLSPASVQAPSHPGITPQPLPLSLPSQPMAAPAPAPVPPSQPPLAATLPSQPPSAAPAPSQPIVQTLTIPAAPIRPYSSLNMLTAVTRNTSPTTSFPLQTIIGRVNQERLDHSALSGDRPSSSEKKKTRKKARRAPALDAVTPMIDHTLNTAGDGSVVVNLEVLVRLAMPNRQDLKDFDLPRSFYHYTRHMSSFKTLLRSLGLLHVFDNLPVTTRVHDLMKHLVDLCVRAGVIFPNTHGRRSLFSSEDVLPIELLGFSSNGHINNNARTPKLVGVFVDGNMTLANVVNDTRRFAIARYVVASENRFVLHFGIRSNETIFNVDVHDLCLGSNTGIRPHRCLGLRTYGLFRNDIDAELDHEHDALDEEAIENRCVASDSSGEEDTVVAQLLVPQSNGTQAGSSDRAAGADTSSLLTDVHLPLVASNAATGVVIRSAPSTFQTVAIPVAKLWESNYTPPAPSDSLPEFFSFERKSHITELISTQFVAVNGVACSGFQVKGVSLDAMVEQFMGHMRSAAHSQDWTSLLCDNRIFIQVRINAQGLTEVVSSGQGLEIEVMNRVFKHYLEDRLHDFCIPLIDGYYTLATIPLLSSFSVSEAKRDELRLFGAVVGLALVHGQFPLKINPLLIIYLLCGNDLRALSKDLVMEHFPSLYHTVNSWNELDHNDNNVLAFNEHFFTYHHNFSMSCLTSRSEEFHRSLSWTMLHNAIIGAVPVDHPYFQAFLEGLKLPCKASFNLAQIAHSYFGGASAFVVDLMSTTINSLADLRLTLKENLSDREKRALREALDSVEPYRGASFRTLFHDFLEGIGAPLTDIRPEHYDPVVASTLGNIDQPTYRMKMFCWAALGAPRAILDEDPIKVYLVSDDDPMYAPFNQPDGLRSIQLSEGTISFKTCTRYMLIPVSHLIRLLRGTYDESSEPSNVKAAVHGWLLTEILNGIGTYSTL